MREPEPVKEVEQAWKRVVATAFVELTILHWVEAALATPVALATGHELSHLSLVEFTPFTFVAVVGLVFYFRHHFKLVGLLVLALVAVSSHFVRTKVKSYLG